MIDLHSHILPSIDDGSKNVAESISLLKMLSEQGVSTVVATPHFYANDNSVEEFLFNRNSSFNLLNTDSDFQSLPKVILGAEVKYYEGISRLNDLNKLCIGNTKLLLLEMSFRKWTDYIISELVELSTYPDITIVLAHIERYLGYVSSSALTNILSNGILTQSNAEFFLKLGTRRKAFNMLLNNKIHFIGSDCHNIDHRPPRIGEAAKLIKRKAGESFFNEMNLFAESFFYK